MREKCATASFTVEHLETEWQIADCDYLPTSRPRRGPSADPRAASDDPVPGLISIAT